MRPCQPMACLGNAEIAVLCVSAQAVGLEILLAMMADRNALLGARFWFCGRGALGLDRFSRRGFCGGCARRWFFQRGGLRRGARLRLLSRHRRSPLSVLWGNVSAVGPASVVLCARGAPNLC